MLARGLIEKGDKVIVGVSGGPDSMCLLHVLNTIKNEKKIQFDIIACHVNHMIRKNALLDEQFVENYCKKESIPVFILHAKVLETAKKDKIGTEEAGRAIRYQFFEEIAKKEGANKIATAHNANDNAETVMMNILRGTSINGLKGIEEKRGNIIRPLLSIQREEIEAYCQEVGLNPREDESNHELIYTRNKIRNELFPLIQEKFNPNIIEGLNRLSQLATEETEYIQKKAIKAYQEICLEENLSEKRCVLDLKKFSSFELVIKRRVILYTINKILGTTANIQKIHIEDIIKLCDHNIGNKYLTPNKHIKIEIKKKKIYISKIS